MTVRMSMWDVTADGLLQVTDGDLAALLNERGIEAEHSELKKRQWAVVDGVLYGADAEVATWVNRRLGGGVVATDMVAFGVLDEGGESGLAPDTVEGKLIAGAIFFNHHADLGDITVSVAADDIAASRPKVINAILAYPFGQLGCKRITAEIDLSNQRSVRQAVSLGFVQEGRKRKMGVNGGDVGVFGLLAEECKFWTERQAA